MPFANFVHLTNASSGAPRTSGTQGDLVALMDWALPQVGIAIEASSGNERLYRPAVGNRFRYYFNDNTAASGGAQRCVVRVVESGTIGSLVDPTPVVSLVADTSCNFLKSSAASTVDRAFHIVAWDTGFIYASQYNGTAWEIGNIVDFAPSRSADTWNTYIGVRNSTNVTTSLWLNQNPQPVTSVGPGYIVRSYDGTVKSTRAAMVMGTGAGFGNAGAGWPAANAGADGEIDSEAVAIACTGAQSSSAIGSAAIMKRGWIPHMRNPLCNGIGSLNDGDTYTDSAYDPLSEFVILKGNGTNFVALEISNTYRPPQP